MSSKEKPIVLLNEWHHARLRTEMWLSSRDIHTQTVIIYENNKPIVKEMTWVPALFTAFREIVDNALDEIVTHGHGNTLTIDYNEKDLIFKISDNGRGIPIYMDDTHKQYAATLAMTQTKAGRNFEERTNNRGLNGVGASIVNFCSEYFTLDIYRDKKHFNQRFTEGKDDLVIEDPFIVPYSEKNTGTSVEFKLSKQVFKNTILPEIFIRSRVFEIALIYHGKLKVIYNGQEIKLPKKNPLDVIFPNKIHIPIQDNGFDSQYYLVPDFFDDNTNHQHSFVNAIPTLDGGTHIDSFKKIFFSGMLDALSKESKRRKLTPNRSDMMDGLLIFNITEMNEAVFDSQSKSRLKNEKVNVFIKNFFDDPEIFKNIIKKNPEWINNIYEKCAKRTMKKEDDESSKLAKRNLKVKVEKLADAASKHRNFCSIFICEGDSAKSGIVEARDSDIHGALPLRGKILNVFDVTPKAALENKVLSDIMSAIGLDPTKKAIRSELRYGKIYITTDADDDGHNIAALLISFFYKYWKELFDPNQEPYIYLFDTPLIIAKKGNQKKYWFSDNYHEFDPEKYAGWSITRAKGLAALIKEDWEYMLKNPKALPVVDDGKLEEALDLMFNKDKADDRKDWIAL